MEGKLLDNIFGVFELDLPKDLGQMEDYIKFILPKIKPWGSSLNDENLWQSGRWMEIQGNDAWDKSFVHIFMPDGEYLIFDNGVLTRRAWRKIGNSLMLDEIKNTILYDVEYINDNFLILRQNGLDRYFVLGKESFVRKIKFDWLTAMDELYNVYRYNSKFSMWAMFLFILLIILFGWLYM